MLIRTCLPDPRSVPGQIRVTSQTYGRAISVRSYPLPFPCPEVDFWKPLQGDSSESGAPIARTTRVQPVGDN
jgi:hypothetical protein